MDFSGPLRGMSSAERIGAVHKKSMFVASFIDCLLACLIENASFSLNLSCVKVFSTTRAGKQAITKGALDPYDSHCEWNGNDYDKSKEEWLLTDLCHPILRRLVLKTMLLFKNHVSRRRGTLCDMVKAGAKKILNRRLERLDYSHECWRFKEKNDGSKSYGCVKKVDERGIVTWDAAFCFEKVKESSKDALRMKELGLEYQHFIGSFPDIAAVRKKRG